MLNYITGLGSAQATEPELSPALAGYLIRAYCTKVEQTATAGQTIIEMVFEH